MTTIGDVGERGLIQRLASMLPTRPDVRVGVGDDAAVIRGEGGDDLLLTSDGLVEGRHFVKNDDPALVGHKAIGRVLSDIAAMGGEPRWALINLVAPRTTSLDRIDQLFAGALRTAEQFGLCIVGGDTGEGDRLELHVFGVGRVPEGAAVLRTGAKKGQILYVTGELGGSAEGRHLSFEPRVEQGMQLRELGWAKAMIDVSDGLATDAAHLVRQTGTSAVLVEHDLPVSNAAYTPGGRSPVERVLFDGEDFELLFTVNQEVRSEFENWWKSQFKLRCTAIGEITDRPGCLYLVDDRGNLRDLPSEGFDHFRTSPR